jgi:hypothetical protein
VPAVTLQGHDEGCLSGHYLHKAFFWMLHPELGQLVYMDPDATAAVHVPALDVVQLVLGLVLELIELMKEDINVAFKARSILPSWNYNSPTAIRAFLQRCSRDHPELLQILEPSLLGPVVYGRTLADFTQWGAVLRTLFADTCPELAILCEIILQPADLSDVPSIDDILGTSVLAPYAQRARQQHAMLGAQREANVKAAYECGLKVAALFDATTR